MTQGFGPLYSCGDMEEAAGFRSQIGSTRVAIAAIWGMNLQIEDLFLMLPPSLLLCQVKNE